MELKEANNAHRDWARGARDGVEGDLRKFLEKELTRVLFTAEASGTGAVSPSSTVVMRNSLGEAHTWPRLQRELQV